MMSGPKVRILKQLATFQAGLETAWDVPRGICLPGIAEALGVVRSALHQPLAELIDENLVTERKAHVIDGGSRRRKVYHITEAGRSECNNQEVIVSKMQVGELFGNPPAIIDLKGRENEINNLLTAKKVILTGLPGIGKTSLLRVLSEELVKSGEIVRFASMQSFKDISDIFTDWGLSVSTDKAALHATKGEVLILDELQEVSSRHLARVADFAQNCDRIILASRAPIPFEEGFEIIEVPPLEIKDAIQLLPDWLEQREIIAERLGGHPLALQLHDSDSTLPEEGADLQAWVKEVVLSDIGEEMAALDELSLLPVPVPVNYLQNEQHVGTLDDYALLRWHTTNVELHHLVRNVRSSMLSVEHHNTAAKYWSDKEGDLCRLIELHHILESGGDIEAHLLVNAEALMIRSNAGLATLIGSAIARHPTAKLHRLAALVAIERGEAEVASEHLENCDAPDLDISLALLQGRFEEIDLDNSDAKLLLSEAARRIDDRLPGTQINYEIDKLLEKIDLSDLSKELRNVMLVAIAHVKHACAINAGDIEGAREIREGLRFISHSGDPQLSALDLRAEIAETSPKSPSFEKVTNKVFSMTGLRAVMLQMAIIEKVDKDTAKKLIEKVQMPDKESQSNLSSARRIAAMIWYWRSQLDTHNRFSSLAEAIALWNQAMCPEASKQAAQIMHSML